MTLERILITGGAGFLGQAILRELAKLPVPPKEIRLLDRELAGVGQHANAITRQGDISDYATVLEACRGMEVVIHAAALVDWGEATAAELERVNVAGTENVIRACVEAGVPALVYTSTMDVVCGKQPVVDADETWPFPDAFANDYARTKAEAETLVLAADGARREPRAGEDPVSSTLATCAIRPCGMFGEGDPYHVANVLRVVQRGQLPFRPGNGRAVFQHVYVGNVAHAHLLAAKRLLAGDPVARGRAYFITDDTPAIDFLEFMEKVLLPLGLELPPRSRRMPYAVMLTVGAAMELVAWLLRPFYRLVPTLTRSSVRFVCHTHSFVGEKARRELGYAPVYSEDESLNRTIAYFRGVLSA